jgi:hypothetical protein
MFARFADEELDMRSWQTLSMLRDDRSCTRFVIGEKIIRGIGARRLRIPGGSRAMCMIVGISRMRDVLAMDLMLGIVAFLGFIAQSQTL